MKPIAAKGMKCPLWKEDVSKVCHKCQFYCQLRGTNPQTGAEVDNWQCAITALVVTTLEGASQARQAGAATESFRNLFAKRTDQNSLIGALVSSRFTTLESRTESALAFDKSPSLQALSDNRENDD